MLICLAMQLSFTNHRRTHVPSATALQVVVIPIFLAFGCAQSDQQTEGHEEKILSTLSPDRQIDTEGLVWALAEPDPKPVKDLKQTQRMMAEDPTLRPLADALGAAGWTEEEAAVMVTAAGVYNSDQPFDPARMRADQLKQAFLSGLHQIEQAIEEYEAEHDVAVDRQAIMDGLYGPFFDAIGEGGVQ